MAAGCVAFAWALSTASLAAGTASVISDAVPAAASDVPASTDIIGEAVDKAMQGSQKAGGLENPYASGRVESIVQSALETLQSKNLSWNATKSSFADYLNEKVAPIVGLAPSPSMTELRRLRMQAQEAQKHREQLEAPPKVPAKCAECVAAKAKLDPKVLLPRAKEAESTANKRLQEAAAWAAQEAKRRRELPALALAKQREANRMHQLRMQAEKKALEAQITRVAIGKIEAADLAPLQEAVARQRLVDRLRAAEDARVAACAAKAAAAARKLKLKKGPAATAKVTPVSTPKKIVKAKPGAKVPAAKLVEELGAAAHEDAGEAIDDAVTQAIDALEQELPA